MKMAKVVFWSCKTLYAVSVDALFCIFNEKLVFELFLTQTIFFFFFQYFDLEIVKCDVEDERRIKMQQKNDRKSWYLENILGNKQLKWNKKGSV